MVVATTDPLTPILYASYAAVAAVLIVRRPSNVVGWILLAIPWSALTTSVTPHLDADVDAILAGSASPRDEFLLWINGWTGAAAFVCYLALTILFPSGSLPVGRWRRPAILMLGVAIGIVVLTAFAPTIDFNPDGGVSSYAITNPYAFLPGLPIWSLLPTHGEQILVVVAMVAVSAGSMIVRYHRSTGVVRLQLRWLVLALAFVVLAVAFGFATLLVLGSDGGFGWIPALIAYPSVPLAVGVAVLRYRLYEIDRIISRTISYAVVTAALALVFVAAVLALQAVLAPITGGETLAVAASTLVVFALFQPVRRRVQRAVDQRFDRARYDAERTAAAFAARMRDEVDIATVTGDLGATVRVALNPTTVGLWLRGSRE
jgi:MFS family permease